MVHEDICIGQKAWLLSHREDWDLAFLCICCIEFFKFTIRSFINFFTLHKIFRFKGFIVDLTSCFLKHLLTFINVGVTAGKGQIRLRDSDWCILRFDDRGICHRILSHIANLLLRWDILWLDEIGRYCLLHSISTVTSRFLRLLSIFEATGLLVRELHDRFLAALLLSRSKPMALLWGSVYQLLDEASFLLELLAVELGCYIHYVTLFLMRFVYVTLNNHIRFLLTLVTTI